MFDSSAALPGGTDLPLLGTIALPEDVTCRVDGCYARTLSAMTPDGTTLFLAGDERVLVVPVPAL